MNQYEQRANQRLTHRTKAFALRVIHLVECLPKTRTADILGRQLLRAGTLVGANYRAAERARSPFEFCVKLGIVEEEADECVYWIELLVESGLVKRELVADLLRETNEMLAMIVASIRTARSNNKKQSGPHKDPKPNTR